MPTRSVRVGVGKAISISPAATHSSSAAKSEIYTIIMGTYPDPDVCTKPLDVIPTRPADCNKHGKPQYCGCVCDPGYDTTIVFGQHPVSDTHPLMVKQ